MTVAATFILLGGLVIFFACQPLARRKVPMNRFYGIRIPAAFESEERWYEINAYGGRRMAAWSWLITVTGLTGFLVPPAHGTLWALGTLPVTLLAVLIPVIQILRQTGKRGV